MGRTQVGVEFKTLVGQTLITIKGANKGSDEIIFTTTLGRTYRLEHFQDCCESVLVEDICGEVKDLLNTPILSASEESNHDNQIAPSEQDIDDYSEHTWTFYRLSTNKGTVVIRWYGTSNGYYSEKVDFMEVVCQNQ